MNQPQFIDRVFLGLVGNQTTFGGAPTPVHKLGLIMPSFGGAQRHPASSINVGGRRLQQTCYVHCPTLQTPPPPHTPFPASSSLLFERALCWHPTVVSVSVVIELERWLRLLGGNVHMASFFVSIKWNLSTPLGVDPGRFVNSVLLGYSGRCRFLTPSLD